MNTSILPIYIVNFNTTALTNNAINSIIVNSKLDNYEIIVFDNSNKDKFLLFIDTKLVKGIDNTVGQIIDFAKVVKENSNNKFSPNNYASLKHCYTIDWIINHESRNFLLFDSDIYLKKAIDFIDDSCITVASVCRQMPKWKDKLYPFIQYFNIKMIKDNNIHYFDKNRIMYGYGPDCKNYDTGTSFYDDIISKNLKFKDIDYTEYIEHLGNASWRNVNYMEFIDKCNGKKSNISILCKLHVLQTCIAELNRRKLLANIRKK